MMIATLVAVLATVSSVEEAKPTGADGPPVIQLELKSGVVPSVETAGQVITPASPTSSWVGEWSLASGDGEHGFLSIRDCRPGQDLCRLILETYGRSADDPGKMGGCHYGNAKRPNSEENLRVLWLKGKKATARLVSSWNDKACTLELDLDEEGQQPQVRARLDGPECDYWCSGYTHLPATFTLRSRKPYLQFETNRKVNVCHEDDSIAIREWCTDEQIYSLFERWSLRLTQLNANTGASKYEGAAQWQEGMLEQCRAAGDPGRCVTDAYLRQIKELDAQVYGRFLKQEFTAEQVLGVLHPRFDPRTARTGRQTDVNTRYTSGDKRGKLFDEVLVFFKIAEPSFLPGHLLVLEVLSDGFDGLYAEAFFSLVKAEDGRLRLVAREHIVESDAEPDGNLLTWRGNRSGASLEFDLADYRLNDRERAFGYRVATWGGGTGASYGGESLVLHRLAPEGMKRVLKVPMESHGATWGREELIQSEQERFILIVGPNQHDGHYDWLVKGESIDKRTGRSRATKLRTYVWKDGQYVLAPAATGR